VKKRIEGDTGLSFTEFTYQLIQGYDFYWLYANYNCKLQMGGSDQWGNITTGTELIRRKTGGEAFAFTCPLLTKADGGKFGKTKKLFMNQDAPAESLSEEDLETMEGLVKFDFASKKIQQGINVVSFLFESGIFASKGEARKMIQNGGININRKKIDNIQMTVDS